MRAVAEDLVARGIATWNVEYRRVGDLGGGWPGTLLDVAHAADYLCTLTAHYALDLQRIVVVGHSAGGHLALWLAARPRVIRQKRLVSSKQEMLPHLSPGLPLAGVISLAGLPDLELAWRLNVGNGVVFAFLGGGFDEVPARYALASPAALLPLGVWQVLFHGTEDPHVPLTLSQTYAAAARQAGESITLTELAGVDHRTLREPGSAPWATTIEIIQHMLSLTK